MKIVKIFVFAVLASVLWQVLLPGPRVGVDHPYWPMDVLNTFFAFPQSFREMLSNGLGLDAMSILWVWPVMFAHGLFSTLGLSFEGLTYILGIIPILVFGILGTEKLLGSFGLNKYARFIGQIFFLGNTYALLLIDGGQLLIGVAYSLLPLSFYLYREAIKSPSLKFFFLYSISILLISVFDIRFLYLLAILSALYVLYEMMFVVIAKDFESVSRLAIANMKILVFTGVIFLGFHAYWIFPMLLVKISALPALYSRSQQVDFLSFSTIGHALLSLQPHWSSNVFGRISPLRPEFIFIPILVFLAPVLKRRNKEIGFWLIVALMGIFLSKGTQEPLPNIYSWLFVHIPGFVLFRDPTKFYFLILLSFSVLITFSLDRILSLNHVMKPFTRKAIFVLVVVYLIWLARPIYLGEMTGLFSKPAYLQDYQKLTKLLEQDLSFGRILWLPTRPPLGLTSPVHPSVEAIYLTEKRPFSVGSKGSYESLNFLREASFSGELLNVAGVEYVAYPYLDPKRDDMHPDNIKYYYKFFNQLSSQPWAEGLKLDSGIPTIKVSRHQDKVFVAKNLWWVVGSDDIYNQAVDKHLGFENNAFVFPEEFPGLGNRLFELPEAKIILNNKNLTDLAATFLSPSELIFPAKDLDFNPNASGWWKREGADEIRWREFLSTKYGISNQDFDLGGGWAVAEGQLSLEVPVKNHEFEYTVLARVLESSRSGSLSFYEGNALINRIDTKVMGDFLHWVEVGESGGGNSIRISSAGDINVVNALVIVEKSRWREYQDKALELKENKRIVNLDDNNGGSEVDLRVEEIGPTKFSIRVSNLKNPVLLVLSQNFNPNWRMGNVSALPVYSFLNGFWIDRDGEYLINYYPQDYVKKSLIISAGMVLFLLVMAVLIFRKESK